MTAVDKCGASIAASSYLIATSTIALGIAAFSGILFASNIGHIGAIALEGFQILACLPFTIATIAITTYLDSAVVNLTPSQKKLVSIIGIIAKIGLFFGSYIVSWVICQSIDSLPVFSILEALRLSGIILGFSSLFYFTAFYSGVLPTAALGDMAN